MLVAQVKNDLRRAGASYDVVIAVNDLGLVASEAASGNSALVYYSLEVYNEGNVHITWDVWRKRIKQRERIQFSKIRYLLIQDEDRARLMFDDMKQPLDLSKFLQLPVTHPGRSRKERTMYLRDLFPELQNKFILLQQNVGWPRRSEEIAKMAKRADRRNFCIVFNGSLFPDCPDSYLQHKGFLDYHDLDKLVGSADIGLIFYLDDNENDALISHASGQLSHFAMLGVPVIASYAPSLERLMTKYKCGVIVKSVEEIYPAAEKIMKSYEQYCSGALACFDAEYDIANYRGAICTKFKNLGAEG